MSHPAYKPPLRFELRLRGGGVFAGHYGINVKWDELFLFTFCILIQYYGGETATLQYSGGTVQVQFSGGEALALHYGTAVLATIFLMQGCCVATYYSSQ